MSNPKGTDKGQSKACQKSTCHKCNVLINNNDKGLQCDVCLMWSHPQCIGISDSEYEFLGSHPSLDWNCGSCKTKLAGLFAQVDNVSTTVQNLESIMEGKFKEVTNEIKEIQNLVKNDIKSALDRATKIDTKFDKLIDETKKEVSILKADIASIMDKSKNFDREQIKVSFAEVVKDQLNERMSNVNEDMSKITTNLTEVKKISEDMKDKEMRANNVIIYRVSEESIERDEQRKADKSFCLDLINEGLGIDVSESDIKSFFRIGKKEADKTRPIMIQFRERSLKNRIMESLNKLKNADEKFKNTSIAHDMTENERKECKNLVLEAKKKEEEDSGEYMYRVRGDPGNLRIVKIKKRL